MRFHCTWKFWNFLPPKLGEWHVREWHSGYNFSWVFFQTETIDKEEHFWKEIKAASVFHHSAVFRTCLHPTKNSVEPELAHKVSWFCLVSGKYWRGYIRGHFGSCCGKGNMLYVLLYIAATYTAKVVLVQTNLTLFPFELCYPLPLGSRCSGSKFMTVGSWKTKGQDTQQLSCSLLEQFGH